MRMSKSLFQDENLAAFGLSLIALAAYLTTISPAVSFVDAGELAAVATTLGIAHPTGYPLFTLLGRCAAMIPLGTEEIVRLNVLAALFSAAAVGWFYKMSLLFFRSKLFVGNSDPDRSGGFSLAAACGSLVLAFSTTFWSQSVAVEVYSLHLLLLILTTYFFVRGVEEQKNQTTIVSSSLVLFAFGLGLSFANHLTTMLLAPAFLFLYFRVLGLRKESFYRVAKLAPFLFLGLSVYLYLPVRAGAQPPLNWGNPVELERFFWHITGKQYRSWMFSSFENAEKQFRYFTLTFPQEFHWILLLVLAVGIVAALVRSGKLFFFLLLLFSGCLLYAINYDIHDIDSYFLLAYLAAAWLIVFGLNALQIGLSSFPQKARYVVLVLLIFPAIQWWQNKPNVDQSDNYLVHDYTHNILDNVEANAFILTYQWDYFVASSYYQQYVRKQRPDVVVLDKELLRRSWYFRLLEQNYARLIERSRVKVNLFLTELYKFEHDMPYDAAVIEARFNDMVNDFIDKAMGDRPVYVGSEIEPQFAFNYHRVPEGLLFRLLRENEKPNVKALPLTFRPTAFENDYTRGIRFLSARMLTMNAALMHEQQRVDLALQAVDRALAIDSTFKPARTLREELQGSVSSSAAK